ncbi:hypothetical protein AB0K51_04290 [Kitasatospora sp. NPDC049285]|uniref:hypothetical protein n=1 Tax=Kitasatospora sp. NPDC049285 TaxID=3157096 RepID=UPI00343C711B
MDTTGPGDVAALRAAFGVDDGGESTLGWDAVHAFDRVGNRRLRHVLAPHRHRPAPRTRLEHQPWFDAAEHDC